MDASADATERFAAVLDEDGNVAMLELGRIEHKDRAKQTLTVDEQAAHDAVLADPMGGRILTAAASLCLQHCEHQVHEHGGTIHRGRTRARDGHAIYRLERFPTTVERLPGRSGPRARGAGRPRAAARSSSRGGDSGDNSDLGDPEPGPSSGRRLNSRAEIDRWLVERKTALDRVVAGWSQ